MTFSTTVDVASGADRRRVNWATVPVNATSQPWMGAGTLEDDDVTAVNRAAERGSGTAFSACNPVTDTLRRLGVASTMREASPASTTITSFVATNEPLLSCSRSTMTGAGIALVAGVAAVVAGVSDADDVGVVTGGMVLVDVSEAVAVSDGVVVVCVVELVADSLSVVDPVGVAVIVKVGVVVVVAVPVVVCVPVMVYVAGQPACATARMSPTVATRITPLSGDTPNANGWFTWVK